ncbi:MAG: 2,3-bisphosphoglycerate-independent phosphoglycerate mutase [Acetanaerobacterium sp.]
MKKPLALIILDGFGINESEYGNAIKAAKKPYIDKLFAQSPITQIGASGMDVGLPDGQMGNSEVGHTNIGAGRIVYQELTRITKSILDGDFFENKALIAACANCKKNGSALHLIGLVSDGGVHSHNTHLYGLLTLAKQQGVKDVYVHCLTDGRDVPPNSGAQFINELEAEMARIGVGRVATIIGRYYGMDRDNRWERVEKAYAAIAYGEGIENTDAVGAIKKSYGEGVTDEFIAPVVVTKDAQLKSEDSVIFFNFRPDRAREIARAIVDPDFTGFARKTGLIKPYFVCMTQYDRTMPNVTVAFTPQTLTNTFGEYLSQHGISQLRIAETEKYPHVTFFFNGGVEKVYEGESRVLIPSPKVATYDLQPEMSANLVTDAVVERIEKGLDDVIILNFANCDMVGHTGVFDAAVSAVETVNACLERVVEALLAKGGIALITADHGNADKMYEPDGSPFTAHTTNPVPLVVAGMDCRLRTGGRLCDIAPTMLDILGLAKPAEMTGVSLIEK